MPRPASRSPPPSCICVSSRSWRSSTRPWHRIGAPALRPFARRPCDLRLQYWISQKPSPEDPWFGPQRLRHRRNPLELGSAAIFAFLFVVVSFVSNWAKAQFGTSGIYRLAAIVGVTDIDPFVLNLAQGGTTGMSDALAAAILIAASSNNILKAIYAAFFAGGRATAVSAAVLVLLAAAGVTIAVGLGNF